MREDALEPSRDPASRNEEPRKRSALRRSAKLSELQKLKQDLTAVEQDLREIQVMSQVEIDIAYI